MRVVITGGGTGGHIYPALAVAEVLLEETGLARGQNSKNNSASVLYLGTKQGIEAQVAARNNLPFLAIEAGALRGGSLPSLIANLGRMGRGLIRSFLILGRFRPQVILATGGYVSAPVVMAGWLRGIPCLLYLPDVDPGWAVRVLAYFASRVAITSWRSAALFPRGKMVETGYPVRRGFSGQDKAKARAGFGLEPNRKTLLVWGGSRGAHSINLALSRVLPQLLDWCQVIHLCGEMDEGWLTEVRAGLKEAHRQRYLVYGYLHEELPRALAAADLAVSRAGAATLGEFPAVGLPSILVPYPYAGGHQERNAQIMVAAGAAIKLEEGQLDRLLPTIEHLLRDEARLEEMSAQARSLARPEAPRKLAALVAELAERRGHG